MWRWQTSAVATFPSIIKKTMKNKPGNLQSQEPSGPLPMNRIKRVDTPTNRITSDVQRIDMRNTAYGLATRGEYGSVVQKGMQKTLPDKYPLSAAQKDIIDHIALLPSNPVANARAPIPQDPEGLTRHIKSAGYFLKADLVGTCRVPLSAKAIRSSPSTKMP
jgi:hypothetical protein